MQKIEEAIAKCIEGVASNPLMAFALIIFLVQSYIQIVKLDDINDTLLTIHKDNAIIENYITAEKESTKEYIYELSNIQERLIILLEKLN